MKTHIAQILETKINYNPHLSVAEKDELLSLVSAIDSNLQQLAKTHQQAGDKIHQIAENGAHAEGTHGLKEMGEEIRHSIEEFEVTHPQLVELVNRLCIMLANLGI